MKTSLKTQKKNIELGGRNFTFHKMDHNFLCYFTTTSAASKNGVEKQQAFVTITNLTNNYLLIVFGSSEEECDVAMNVLKSICQPQQQQQQKRQQQNKILKC